MNIEGTPAGKFRQNPYTSLSNNPLSLYGDSFVNAAESPEPERDEDMEITTPEETVKLVSQTKSQWHVDELDSNVQYVNCVTIQAYSPLEGEEVYTPIDTLLGNVLGYESVIASEPTEPDARPTTSSKSHAAKLVRPSPVGIISTVNPRLRISSISASEKSEIKKVSRLTVP